MPSLPAPDSPHRSASATSGPRPGLLALLALLLVAALASALVPAPALAVPPSTVSVQDTTGTVDAAQVEQELAVVDFRTEVELVALVLDVTEHGFDVSEDAALNDSVLDHARTAAPELLSEDGQHFAEGTVILALDPENRFLGTYAGEDVKLDDGGFTAVQEAMTEDAQNGDWHAALQAGAEEYADLLLRPWWQHPGALIIGLLAPVSAIVTALSLLGLRRAARRRVDQSLPRLADVRAKRALTDAAARTLPASSPYGQAVLADHEEYGRELAEAERLDAELPAPGRRRWSWGLSSKQRESAREFERTVGSLDDADDEIIAASDLLHRIGDWRQAWERELEPLRDSISRLPEVLAEQEDMSDPEQRAAAELEELCGDVEREMDDLTARLEADQIDPESALEQLDTLTRELSAGVRGLQTRRIDRRAEDEDEDEAEVLWEASADVEGGGYRSVRARRHRWESARGGDVGNDDFWHLSPVLWYSLWHSTSDSALESHRDPASSGGGSTAGFSSAGFSGAGSSSRF